MMGENALNMNFTWELHPFLGKPGIIMYVIGFDVDFTDQYLI